jgi:titin
MIEGNYIGTDATGTNALGNITGVGAAYPHTIVGNLISGNQVGISGPGNNSQYPASIFQVQGNLIGTDATGMHRIPNGTGILLSGAGNALIGGTTAATRNVISGNSGDGVYVGAGGMVIQGNYIGTDISGMTALGNGIGVVIAGGINGTVGGIVPGAGNLISGNNIGIQGGVIQGNLIGTDATGTHALGNSIGIGGADLIGGTTSTARNIISGNGIGIRSGVAPIEGNYIGTDITGTMAVGNNDGIWVTTGFTVGGTIPGAGNVISGNADAGIRGFGDGNQIQGNLIGTDYTGTKSLGNGSYGIDFQDGGNNNLIGGLVTGARNIISGNGIGIFIQSTSSASGNVIEGNYIGTDITGTTAVGNSDGVALGSGTSNNTIGGTTAAARNIISGNRNSDGNGVVIGSSGISASLPSGNVVEGNYIGTDVTGSYALGNNRGVLVDAINNLIGGTVAGAGNTIANNVDGVAIGKCLCEKLV